MSNWYDIPGIEFHSGGIANDFQITFNGVRDYSGVMAEMTMWDMFSDEYPERAESPDYAELFEEYMRENADYVKQLILMDRGELEL